MPDLLFTTDELSAFLGATADPAGAQLVHDLVVGAMQAETWQHLFLVTDDVYTVPDDPTRLVRRPTFWPGSVGNWTDVRAFELVVPLPEHPVVSVSAVAALAQGVGYRVLAGQLLVASTALWVNPMQVTYTHGYATIPADLKRIGLAAAARMLGNPTGERVESLGGYGVTHATVDVFSQAELTILRRYQRRPLTADIVRL